VVGETTTSTTMFKGKFLFIHLRKSHAFQVSISLMVYLKKNSYEFFCRYIHSKRKDKKRQDLKAWRNWAMILLVICVEI
jgi:hypothetical protein